MKLKLFFNITLVLFALKFGSCADLGSIIVDMPPETPAEIPPFVITKPIFELNGRPFNFNYSGVVFNFFNTGEEIVDAITVSFRLFDQRTQNSPLIGTNKFEITKRELVLPEENKEIIISLDHFIYIAPTEAYLIDFFYVSRINYVDGHVWEDKYGKYRVRAAK